jgi:DNA-binding transcriptional MerR regulator
MQKKQFRIGELAKNLGVERFVIRFWEKEFNVTGNRSEGGQRFYEAKDLEKFRSIKTLLYEQGFTIAGAKKQFKKTDPQMLGSHRTTLETPKTEPVSSSLTKLTSLKEKLLALQQLLKN